MAQTQYIVPQIAGYTYDQKPPSNFGEAYAAGIGEAGKSLAGAISAIGDQYKQNRAVDDSLAAMHEKKILSDDDYQSIAGKSTEAKQTMLGLYAGQWLADQAQNRAVALQKGQYTGQIDVEHQKLLDTISAVQGKYGPGGPAAAGVNPKQIQIGNAPAPAQPAQPAQPTQPVQGPQVIAPPVGAPVQKNMLLRPGVTPGQMIGPNGQVVRGWNMPDGSFRPNP